MKKHTPQPVLFPKYSGTVPGAVRALCQNRFCFQNSKGKYPYMFVDYATKINSKFGFSEIKKILLPLRFCNSATNISKSGNNWITIATNNRIVLAN
jgi:hypothetical protein